MVDRTQVKKFGSANRDELTVVLDMAFNRALALESELSAHILDMEGMSGRLYRMFINNLVRLVSKPRYLEVGSWTGSTVCSAMDKNVVKVLCIDNWSQFSGPKDQFLENTSRIMSPHIDFSLLESDFRAVDTTSIGMFNIYMFDGPHEETDQYDGLALFDPALDNDLIFIVDDWNWQRVRDGTLRAIQDTGFRIDYCIEVRSTLDEDHATNAGRYGDWHNGYCLSKISRIQRRV